MLRRVTKETIQIQNERHSDEGSNLTSLIDVESVLQTLGIRADDSENFSEFESGSDNERSIWSNYRLNHDTLEEREEDSSEQTPTPKLDTTILSAYF